MTYQAITAPAIPSNDSPTLAEYLAHHLPLQADYAPQALSLYGVFNNCQKVLGLLPTELQECVRPKYADKGLYYEQFNVSKAQALIISVVQKTNDWKALAYVLATLPEKSETTPNRLTYYKTIDKMATDEHYDDAEKNKRQIIKIRKYLSAPELSAIPADELEKLADELDELTSDYTSIEARITEHDTSDYNTWEEAYTSDKIRSCMSNYEYGVGQHETWRCYLLKYYTNNALDNSLRLVVLRSKAGDIVARFIGATDPETGEKYRVNGNHSDGGHGIYGDDNILPYADKHYPKRDGYHDGLTIVSVHDQDNLIKPYIDGDNYRAELSEHYALSDANKLLTLTRYGDIDCQDTGGLVEQDNSKQCECCGDYYHEDDMRLTQDPYGDDVELCRDCYSEHVYEVYAEHGELTPMYIANDNFHRYNIVNIDGDYYDTDYSEVNDIVRCADDEWRLLDDTFYCDYTQEYYPSDDAVHIDNDDIAEHGWGSYEVRTINEFTYNDDSELITYIGEKANRYYTSECDITGIVYLDHHIQDTYREGDKYAVIPTQEALDDYPELADAWAVVAEWLDCVGA